MTASAHTTAMQARIPHDDFIDSIAPFDFDPERGEQWRLPAVKAWEPAAPSVWSRIFGWLGGLAS